MKRKNILEIGLFAMGLLIVLGCLNYIMRNKAAAKTMLGFRYEPKNTIDVVFLGNSHMNQGVLPIELWNSYGITAYNDAMMSQTGDKTYYVAEEVISEQSPQIIVVDLFSMIVCDTSTLSHVTVDNLRFDIRMKAIANTIPENDKLEYYVPLYCYHDRWKELEYKDFIPPVIRYMPRVNYRKGATIVGTWMKTICSEEVLQVRESVELSEDVKYWNEQLMKLCKKNDVELIYVVLPYSYPISGSIRDTVSQMKQYNALEIMCKENDVTYINLFNYLDEMDFDFATDMADESHVNAKGAVKITNFLGKYLKTNYVLEDRRSEKMAEKWNAAYIRYTAERDNALEAIWNAEKSK